MIKRYLTFGRDHAGCAYALDIPMDAGPGSGRSRRVAVADVAEAARNADRFLGREIIAGEALRYSYGADGVVAYLTDYATGMPERLAVATTRRRKAAADAYRARGECYTLDRWV